LFLATVRGVMLEAETGSLEHGKRLLAVLDCLRIAVLVAEHLGRLRRWRLREGGTRRSPPAQACYPCHMFNFGKPKTAGDWIVHIAGAIVAIFLVWWMLRMYVL
jgi:hypothetical protein